MTSSCPLVGLTNRRWSGAVLGSAVSFAYADAHFDVSPADYPAAVAAAGGLPVNLCREADPEEAVGLLDGLIVTGGADIDPSAYGAPPSELIGPTEPDRDRWELALLAAAIARGVPILGICRGMQLLNVALGGSLIADLPLDAGDHHPGFAGPRSLRVHPVELTAGSTAGRIYGEHVAVNSLHHQGVDLIGRGLVASGRSPDGLVEAIEIPDRDVLGLQWHPEALERPDPAMSWLMAAAHCFRERPVEVATR